MPPPIGPLRKRCFWTPPLTGASPADLSPSSCAAPPVSPPPSPASTFDLRPSTLIDGAPNDRRDRCLPRRQSRQLSPSFLSAGGAAAGAVGRAPPRTGGSGDRRGDRYAGGGRAADRHRRGVPPQALLLDRRRSRGWLRPRGQRAVPPRR